MICGIGVEKLTQAGNPLKREDWIREAEECEKAGSVATCQAIMYVYCGPRLPFLVISSRNHMYLTGAPASVAQR
jgi:pre-mRNA-processing factor 6